MLKEQEAGAKIADICRKYGIAAATFYKFKGKHGGMYVSDARRLKALEEERARLRKLLAEQMLDNAILKDVAKKMVTPDAKRKALTHACDTHGVSQRRACKALNVYRTSVRYRSIRPDDDALREAMKPVAAQRRRFGYRRIHVMLERQGIVLNQKKLRRLYAMRGCRFAAVSGASGLWARAGQFLSRSRLRPLGLDFVSDAFTDGRRLRVLAVIDDYTRECLALIAGTSLSGSRVVRELDAVITRRGRPAAIMSDNGAELTSMAVLRCFQQTGVK